MPKIGLRIIKSAVAVFLCFVVYELRGEVGIPFYSAIAAILCMQPYVGSSKKVALNRVIATFLGGLSGMLVLLLGAEHRLLGADAAALFCHLGLASCR